MKVIILAGGWGSRLGSQTQHIPKPMVSIGGKPILWHIMKIYSHYGCNDFILSLGVKAEVIKNYFLHFEFLENDFTVKLPQREMTTHSSQYTENWNVTLADTGMNTLKGARIKRLEKYLDDEINMVTYGDGVADINIEKLINFHKSHGKILTITGVHPPARFGEIIEENGRAISFEEKPQVSTGLINGGYMVFNKELLDYLSEDENCDLEIRPFQELVAQNQVMVYKHTGQWACMDHERDVIYLNDQWNSNKAFWRVWE